MLTLIAWYITVCKQNNYTDTRQNCLKFNTTLNDPKRVETP